jgi:mitochondrial chaperone BCS1
MDRTTGTPWETITLTTLSRDRDLFTRLLTEARDMAMKHQQGKLVIHTAWGIDWRPFGQPREKRSMKSVVLAQGVAEKIENDVKAFLDRRQWYADRGISFHEVYHLYLLTHCRNSISKRLPPARSTRFRKDLIHSSPCWLSII